MTKLDDLKSLPLMQNLSEEDLKAIADASHIRSAHAEINIIEEDEKTNSIYLVLEGSLDVLKLDSDKKENFFISTIEAHNYFGEMSFYDDSPRSTTVKTKTPCTLLEISKEKILHLPHGRKIVDQIKANITNQKGFFDRLRVSNARLVQSLQNEKRSLEIRNEFGNFFILTVIQTIIVIFVNYILVQENEIKNAKFIYSNEFVWSYLIIVAIPCFVFVRFSNKKFHEFGLTLGNVKKTILDTAIALVLIFIGFFIMQQNNVVRIAKVLDFGFLIYLFHAFLQEFVAKGVSQTALFEFFGEKKIVLPILISSALFGIIHIHFGWQAVLITFSFGVILGFLFQRHRSIYGITLIHAIMGSAAFNIHLI